MTLSNQRLGLGLDKSLRLKRGICVSWLFRGSWTIGILNGTLYRRERWVEPWITWFKRGPFIGGEGWAKREIVSWNYTSASILCNFLCRLHAWVRLPPPPSQRVPRDSIPEMKSVHILSLEDTRRRSSQCRIASWLIATPTGNVLKCCKIKVRFWLLTWPCSLVASNPVKNRF